MTRIVRAIALAVLAITPVFAFAADDPAQRKDLTAVIALQGLPCGEVVSYDAKGDREFVATCKDGNRYHVFVDKDGRVKVEKAR